MKIKNFIADATQGEAKLLSDQTNKTFWTFLLNIGKINPVDMMQNYNSVFESFDISWTKIKHSIKIGRKTNHILLHTVGAFKLDDFILQQFNFKINHKNFTRMNFTHDKFRELAYMETAMLLAKYNNIYVFEFRLAILQLALQYFNCIETDIWDHCVWTFTSDDITSVIDEILEAEGSSLQPYIDRIDKNINIAIPYHCKPKMKDIKLVPQCREDILSVLSEDMTSEEKCNAIMDNFHDVKSVRTAQRLLQKYNLTKKYNYNNQDNTSSEIESLRLENAALKEEVERLQAVIESIQNSREPKTIPIPP